MDFSTLASELLCRSESLCAEWFPAGKKRGHEFVVGDLQGNPGESLSINLRTGQWSDFADGEKGGDLISLYAAMHGIEQGEAYRQLTNGHAPVCLSRPAPARPAERVEPEYQFVLPCPESAEPPDMRHAVYGKPSAYWHYANIDGDTLGFVARYDPRGERKQIIPYVWADGHGWVKKQFPVPRPMYGLDKLRASGPVMIVEGEKAADAAQRIVGNKYHVLTWPGGSNAHGKVDFSVLAGRAVLLWPDADKPGIEAMEAVGKQLSAICPSIKMLDVSGMSEGWDAADCNLVGDAFFAWARPRARVIKGKDAAPKAANEPDPEPTEDRPTSAPLINWPALSGKTPPEREWIVDHWLGVGHPTLFVGPGGVGKTLLAQQVASCLALGVDAMDKVSRPQRVLIWGCEDDHDEFWRRQVSIARWLNRDLSDFSNLFIEPRLGLDNTLLATSYGLPVWTNLRAQLEEQVADLDIDVVIIDNIGQTFGASEVSRHDVTLFLNGIAGACQKRKKTSQIIIGHPARAAGSEFAGSGAWENAVRMRWWFSDKLPDEQKQGEEITEDEQNVRFLCKRKTNYSVKDYRRYQWDEGVFVPEEIDVVGDPVAAEYRRKQARRVVVEGIKKLAAMNLFGGEAKGTNYLPARLEQYGLAEGLTKQQLAKAMRDLMIEGVLVKQVVGKNANRTDKFGLMPAGTC